MAWADDSGYLSECKETGHAIQLADLRAAVSRVTNFGVEQGKKGDLFVWIFEKLITI